MKNRSLTEIYMWINLRWLYLVGTLGIENKEWKKYICIVCGYIFDEEIGDKGKNIPPNTRFEDLDEENFRCPGCESKKSEFEEISFLFSE